MGWTHTYREPGQSDCDYWANYLGPGRKILDCATIRGVFYAAVRRSDTNETFALVIIQKRTRTRSDGLNFCYKDMDDTCGPTQSECPIRILDLLTPTNWEHANAWRARCRATAAAKANRPKVRRMDTVVFARPMDFVDGHRGDTFVFDRRSTFLSPGTGGRYRIPSWRDLKYVVLAPGQT